MVNILSKAVKLSDMLLLVERASNPDQKLDGVTVARLTKIIISLNYILSDNQWKRSLRGDGFLFIPTR